MDRIVYLLGAGFSEPLGLPVIRNFHERSKDLFFQDQDNYAHFQAIFDMIDKLAVCKTYYTIDLLNIEDILSLLEMSSSLAGEDKRQQSFVRYIADVIRAYTPSNAGRTRGEHWGRTVFGLEPWNYYALFVATLLNFPVKRDTTESPNSTAYLPMDPTPRATEYAVITLNYDLVLESLAADLNDWVVKKDTVLAKRHPRRHFRQDFKSRLDEGGFNGYLAKLHGSIDTPDIVPPTWNKRLEGNILKAWRIAHWLLANANHVRIIGYSLPEADSYIKYLLRAAIVHNSHLKTFDVLCLDCDGAVRKRYDDFVCFRNYRFKSGCVKKYLEGHVYYYEGWPATVELGGLEEVHQRFFSGG
jgi:hypothetical protein